MAERQPSALPRPTPLAGEGEPLEVMGEIMCGTRGLRLPSFEGGQAPCKPPCARRRQDKVSAAISHGRKKNEVSCGVGAVRKGGAFVRKIAV